MDSLLKIDELFRNAKKYSKSEEYRDLLKFLRKSGTEAEDQSKDSRA